MLGSCPYSPYLCTVKFIHTHRNCGMTKKNDGRKIDLFDASILTDRELESIKNLADFERKSLVVGEGIFNLLLPKVEGEIQKRNGKMNKH